MGPGCMVLLESAYVWSTVTGNAYVIRTHYASSVFFFFGKGQFQLALALALALVLLLILPEQVPAAIDRWTG